MIVISSCCFRLDWLGIMNINRIGLMWWRWWSKIGIVWNAALLLFSFFFSPTGPHLRRVNFHWLIFLCVCVWLCVQAEISDFYWWNLLKFRFYQWKQTVFYVTRYAICAIMQIYFCYLSADFFLFSCCDGKADVCAIVTPFYIKKNSVTFEQWFCSIFLRGDFFPQKQW